MSRAAQLEQDANASSDFYHAHGHPRPRPTPTRRPRRSSGYAGATIVAAETVSPTRSDLRALHHRGGTAVVIDRVDFKMGGRRHRPGVRGQPPALPYDRQFLVESLTVEPGEPTTRPAAARTGRRHRAADGRCRLPRRPASTPDTARAGDSRGVTWVIKLGAQTRLGPIFVRGNFVTTPETILEQIPLSFGRAADDDNLERGQRNLGFLQLFNNAPRSRSRARRTSAPSSPCWSRSRSVTNSTA